MGVNLDSLHAAIEPMPHEQARAVRSYLIGALAAAMDEATFAECLATALDLERRDPASAR